MELPVVSEVSLESPQYHEALALRHRVLREPLGLDFSPEELANEPASSHFVATLSGSVVGCLLLIPLSQYRVKMRQVAVDPELQGAGIGRALVAHAETVARQRGYRELVLHARDTAIGFYERLAYRASGELFLENTIPHLLMQKEL